MSLKSHEFLRRRFMGALLGALALVTPMALWAPSASGQAAATGQDVHLYVMAFNVRYGTANDGDNSWANRKEMVGEFLKRESPDIVGLQEALLSQMNDILDAAPHYASIGVAREDGKEDGEYSSILYDTRRFRVDDSDTFWLTKTPDVPGSKDWDMACTRICTWARLLDTASGRAFYIYNTHLDHVSDPSRRMGAAIIAGHIAQRPHPDPVILTGDFNAGENSTTIQYLLGKGPAPDEAPEALKTNPVPLVDTFRVVHPNETVVGTSHGFRGGRDGAKIDYVFSTPNVKTTAAAIHYDNQEGRYLSDHYPISAWVVLPAPAR